jgi:hypothetical protein
MGTTQGNHIPSLGESAESIEFDGEPPCADEQSAPEKVSNGKSTEELDKTQWDFQFDTTMSNLVNTDNGVKGTVESQLGLSLQNLLCRRVKKIGC